MLTDSSFDKFKYIQYTPSDASGLPLIVVLHGSGERGSSLSKLKKREPYLALSKSTCAPNAVVLMPQLPKGTWGEYKASLKKLIDHVAGENGCDTGNISITGHSLGANGAMDMLLAYPDYFSAASILSPCKDYGDKLKTITHIPLWFLYGEKETTFRKYAQSMAARFEKLGGEARETSVKGYGHAIQFTWVSDKYQMFDWLTSFRTDTQEEGGMICDVAKYQGLIDWAKLAPALKFVIIKASGKEKDPYCDRNIAGAKQYGVPWHAYHFLYRTTIGKAQQEARLFSESVGDNTPLFWVLDCEAAWGVKDADAPKIVEEFVAELCRIRGADIRVAIYVAQQKYYDWKIDYSSFAYVWIPGYGEKWKPPMPCDLWQYTNDGRLPGINGKVDLNMLMGTKPLSFFTTAPDDQSCSGGNLPPPSPDDTDTPDTPEGGEIQMFTGKQLAAYCEEMYAHKNHWAYWYGTYGNKCTLSKYNAKKKQYPDHYGSSRTSGYMKDIEEGRRCADCVGMIKSFFWTSGRYDTDPKYGTNNCPDKSADGMIKLCQKTGAIKDIPDIPGLVVWKTGHIGVYVGGGYTIEMRGFAYDCVKRKVKDGPWTKWGMLPDSMIIYDDTPAPEYKLGDRDLKKGCVGQDVAYLQADLMQLGYSLPKYGADGDYGSETVKAVKAFQLAHGLPEDGEMNVGKDFDTLFKALDDDPQQYKHVEITGGSVNVRSTPGTSSKVLGVAHKGDVLPYQGQTQNVDGRDWYLVEFQNQNGWVSSKYAKLVE